MSTLPTPGRQAQAGVGVQEGAPERMAAVFSPEMDIQLGQEQGRQRELFESRKHFLTDLWVPCAWPVPSQYLVLCSIS